MAAGFFYGGKRMSPNWALKMAAVERFGSQCELAMRIGFDESKMSRIVRGRITPRPEERVKIAQALNVPEVELWPELTQ